MTPHTRKPPDPVLLIGAGRVGTAVAELLRRRGYSISGIFSRTEASARRASEMTGAPVIDGFDDLPRAGVILLGVPGEALAAAASNIGKRIARGTAVVHFAGALGVSPIQAVAADGGLPCALHPVQACPDVETAIRRIPGSAWGVTCAPGAEETCSRLVLDLDGTPVAVTEEQRPLWHAAAVTTGNGISALMAEGEALLAHFGIDDPLTVLGPLAAGVVANARERGGGAATLTGPVVRGDTAAVELHIRTLAAHAPELLPAYRRVAELVLGAARMSGRVSAEDEERIAALLERS